MSEVAAVRRGFPVGFEGLRFDVWLRGHRVQCLKLGLVIMGTSTIEVNLDGLGQLIFAGSSCLDLLLLVLLKRDRGH